MSEKPKSFKVGSGRLKVTVFSRTDSRGVQGWAFRRIDGKKGHIFRKLRARAKEEAQTHLDQINQGDSLLRKIEMHHRSLLADVLDTLPTIDDLKEFRAWRNQKATSRALGGLADDYLDFKIIEKGKKTKHLCDVERHLISLQKHLGAETPILKITTSQLGSWISTRMTKRDENGEVTQLSPSRYNNTRAAAVALWNWSHKQGLLTVDQGRVASRLPTQYVPPKSSIRYATNDEALCVLKNVKDQYRLSIVLGLFAGLRPEETAARPDEKISLDRGAIDMERKLIYVSREVAKGAKRPPRAIPITPCLEAWIGWTDWLSGETGPVAPISLAQSRETIRLGKILNKEFDREEGWPHDWLRHTYGTNRNAILRSLHQVAEEMGTSVDMMEEHYHQPIEKSAGESYFSLRPIDLERERVTHHQFAG